MLVPPGLCHVLPLEHECHHLPLLHPPLPSSLCPDRPPSRYDPEQGLRPSDGSHPRPFSSKAIAATVTAFFLPPLPLTDTTTASPPSSTHPAGHLSTQSPWTQSPPMPAGASPAVPSDATVLAPAGSPLTPILSPASLGFGMEGGLWFLDVVKAATEGFADKNVIGRGGFGTVYKVRGRTARDV